MAYLAALAAALAFSTLSAPLVVAVMLGGWALVAAAEWAGLRARPHYAAGLPPRWYVPAVVLPPAQPLEQVTAGYPEPELDEAATWIASAAVREELLGEWPVLIDPEDTQEAAPDEWVVELPTPEPDPEPERAPMTVLPLPDPEPDPEPEPEPEAEPAPAAQTVELRMARYHVDPFAEPERGRFGRRREVPWIAVPAKPSGPRSYGEGA